MQNVMNLERILSNYAYNKLAQAILLLQLGCIFKGVQVSIIACALLLVLLYFSTVKLKSY